MQPELAIPVSFVVALLVTTLATPIAIRVARATAFFDRPAQYKGHQRPTPYLGGAAIMAGILVAAFWLASTMNGFSVLVGCMLALFALGTLDDRVGLSPYLRIAFQVGIGLLLFETGHGWGITDSAALDLVLTIAWVVGLINAVNLMDNMNGAAATTTGISVGAAGALAVLGGNDELGVLCFAVGGACLGFLQFNLARPSRIFMGDGGSTPLGLVVAWATMDVGLSTYGSPTALLIACLLAGLVILDTTLVVISRTRNRRPVLSGGRDHLTHRLATRLGTPERVVAVLVLAQGGLGALTILAAQRSPGAVALLASTYMALAVVAIWVLEQPSWFNARAARVLASESSA